MERDRTLRCCSRDQIPEVYTFSRSIFDTLHTPSDHPSIEEWYSRFDNQNGIVVCATSLDAQSTSNVDVGKIYAYLFAHEKRSSLSDDVGLHIWLCASDPALRKRGLTRSLFSLVDSLASERKLSFVSINTYPDYFPDMNRLLSRPDSGKAFS